MDNPNVDQDIKNIFKNKPYRVALSIILAALLVKLGAKPLGARLRFGPEDLATMQSAFTLVSAIGFIIGIALLIRAIFFRSDNRPDQ